MAEIISVSSILRKYAEKIIEGLKNNLKADNHIASYQLLQSIRVSIDVFGSIYTMNIMMEDYWKWVEFGRNPGKFPPPDTILKWTVQKGFSINEFAFQSKRIPKRKKKLNRESLRRSLAFLIGRKIAKEGIKPSYFASRVLGDAFIHEGIAEGGIWDNLKRELADAIGKEVQIEVSLAA